MKLAPPLLASTRAAALVLASIAALEACSVAHDEAPSPRSEPDLAATDATRALAYFERFAAGEWRVTFENGTRQFDTWQRGPGGSSWLASTHGTDAIGNPWRELLVVYWHPGRQEVRVLDLNPYANTVMDGAITTEGEQAVVYADLYQTGARRKVRVQWTFDGPDRYREALSEAIGASGYELLAEWTYERATTSTPLAEPGPNERPQPPAHWRAYEALFGRAWSARNVRVGDDASSVEATVEWLPYVDAVRASVRVLAPSGESRQRLDAYVFHHPATDTLRCLAFASSGGVYEGDWTALEDGALRLDLSGREPGRSATPRLRLDFAEEGALRTRVWSDALDAGEPGLDLLLAPSDRPRD